MDHHRRLLAQLAFIALGQRRCSTAIPESGSTWRACHRRSIAASPPQPLPSIISRLGCHHGADRPPHWGSGQLGSHSSHPGRLWVRRGLGPPSQGAAAVHTTPIAVPIPVTIGEPDISLRMLLAAWVIHSGPPKWRIVQENHRRPSRDSSRAGTQKLTGFRRVPPIESAVAVAIDALYSSACELSGEPSTAMSAIGSTKRHTAHARGSSPRGARSGP